MTDHREDLGSGQLVRELEAPDHIISGEVSGNATDEKISDSLIEHRLGSGAGIEAGQDDTEWVLARRGLFDLGG